ncbi:hypothetical protein M153_3400010440 [Pseudoloma neurophilia]|uniref:Uncharacterized protein n=1 Tax=Pseudoloma neurophilia TaxID=146866 RepID=A0A0R0M0E9_9MICR|nr:hypothetical protein M153_3400010440 [Pseudoloma neurophilia]
MVLIEFLLLISVLRAQNEEIRTEDFMNFLNPIDSRENRKAQNIDLFIEQYLNFNEDNLQKSDNHGDTQTQKQNNVSSEFFCEIHCDSSLINIENIPSTSLYHLKSDQELLFDEIESFLDSTTFEIPNLSIGASVSSIIPECQCVGLCFCITTQKTDNTTLDINSLCYIDSDILSSDISLSNKQAQQDDIENMDFLQKDPTQIECEIEADLNSTKQCLEQEIYPDITENMQPPALCNNKILPSHVRYNNKHPELIEETYHNFENEINEISRVRNNFLTKSEKFQSTVLPSTSREIVRPRVKFAKKRNHADESNDPTKRKIEVDDRMIEKSHSGFPSGGSDESLNYLVNQAKILFDPDSQITPHELVVHLKDFNYYANPLLKKLIIKIQYEHLHVKNIKYVPIQSNQNIPKIEKSNHTLHIFGTYMNIPSNGGSTFTVIVPKLFEEEAQFENNENPLASAFVPITNANGYSLTLKLARINLKNKFPAASFKLNNGTEYVPFLFYAYHINQVIRFEINRRTNDSVFYHLEYKPQKEVLDINS